MAAAPILRVRDIHRAERFYREVLGATANWAWGEGNPGYRSITVFGAEVHLSSFAGDGAFGTAVYIRVAEVDALAARLRATAPDCLEHGPKDQPWGQREVYLRDPANNQIRLGQTAEGGRPSRAPWTETPSVRSPARRCHGISHRQSHAADAAAPSRGGPDASP